MTTLKEVSTVTISKLTSEQKKRKVDNSILSNQSNSNIPFLLKNMGKKEFDKYFLFTGCNHDYILYSVNFEGKLIELGDGYNPAPPEGYAFVLNEKVRLLNEKDIYRGKLGDIAYIGYDLASPNKNHENDFYEHDFYKGYLVELVYGYNAHYRVIRKN